LKETSPNLTEHDALLNEIKLFIKSAMVGMTVALLIRVFCSSGLETNPT
jgi:hypothetical protein